MIVVTDILCIYVLNRDYSPGAVKTLLLKLLCQESSAQDEGRVLLSFCLQVTCDLQHILTVQPGYLFREENTKFKAWKQTDLTGWIRWRLQYDLTKTVENVILTFEACIEVFEQIFELAH